MNGNRVAQQEFSVPKKVSNQLYHFNMYELGLLI